MRWGNYLDIHTYYLDMLQTVLWPKVWSVSNRRQYWFQQDGARCQTTQLVRDWLETKFGDQVISGKTERPCPLS